MYSAKRLSAWALLVILLPACVGALGNVVDDTIPEITDRVARISFIRGDVQIRRDGNQDWERAVLNLPIIEGDEITTDAGGRVEIQFNSYTHLRLAENSFLRIGGLKDEGIAISLPEGSLILRATAFDADRSYIEIDGPKTTIAVQKVGSYRFDAGRKGDTSVHISVSDDGEARVYSDNLGFALKSGRRARINIEGPRAGEFETGEIASFADELDSWSLERDNVIAQRLKDSHYDKYYDRDIYGAEDLNDYGEWIHTQKYGYVWRPYRNAISQYSDWSPYRYGHWRWVPPYGWTWVNDEPWGWATYHHGRWVYDNGVWYWAPYGYYRNRRSWWSPALVVVTILNNNICWYPLPYNYGYYDYNYYYGHRWRSRHRDRRRGRHDDNGGRNNYPRPNPSPSPTDTVPSRRTIATGGERRRAKRAQPLDVPPGSVVSIPVSIFGRGRNVGTPTTKDVATTVLSTPPNEDAPVSILPAYEEIEDKVGQEIRAARPRMPTRSEPIVIGAAPRRNGGPVDQELRKTRILGDRQPISVASGAVDVPADTSAPKAARKTGAVERPERRKASDGDPIPVIAPREDASPKHPEEPAREVPRYEPPARRVESPRQKDDAPKPRSEPREDRPSRNEPPARSEPAPRSDPPPQRSEPAPRNDPPPQRSEPAPKSDPPPSRSEPSKPDRSESPRKARDGS